MFETQTLAASNAGIVVPSREGQGGQTSSKKQDPLLKGLKEIDSGMYVLGNWLWWNPSNQYS